MIVTYSNGTAVEAVLLSRGNDCLRAAVAGDKDVRSFTLIGGRWISEDCDPVQIEFAWERCKEADVPGEDSCICPKELATRLMAMFTATEGAAPENILTVCYDQRRPERKQPTAKLTRSHTA